MVWLKNLLKLNRELELKGRKQKMTDKSKKKNPIIFNIIAGILFITGGIRFYYRDDIMGMIIYLVAGVLSLLVALGWHLSSKEEKTS